MKTSSAPASSPRLLAAILFMAACVVAVGSLSAEQPPAQPANVLCGIDVLVQNDFRQLDQARVGLITNHTGVDRRGTPTAVRLKQAENVRLESLFSPEHGFAGALDQAEISDTTDSSTGIRVHSLYGKTRQPTADMLSGIDTLVFDIQDIGTRFYTYIATMGGAMEAAEQHGLRFVVLDRPNPINGVDVSGPMLDEGAQSFVGYHTLPLRHGMTVGELARMLKAERFPQLQLQVIACEGWRRADSYDATGLLWINPSPNMRTLNQAFLYPGVGLLEYTNVSVGRGTDTPFEHIGAPWIDARKLAFDLNALQLGGVTFVPKQFTPDSSKFADQPCEGIHILITDRAALRPVEVGLAIASQLRKNHPQDWNMQSFDRLLSSQAVFTAVQDGEPLSQIMELAEQGVDAFRARRAAHLIYDGK